MSSENSVKRLFVFDEDLSALMSLGVSDLALARYAHYLTARNRQRMTWRTYRHGVARFVKRELARWIWNSVKTTQGAKRHDFQLETVVRITIFKRSGLGDGLG